MDDVKKETVSYAYKKVLAIDGANADIMISGFPLYILIKDKQCIIGDTEINFYFNGKPVTSHTIDFEDGDVLSAAEYQITLFENKVEIQGDRKLVYSKFLELPSKESEWEGFPRYRRSPRIIKRINQDKVSISNPPVVQKMGKGILVQLILPPLGMMIVTILVSLLMKRGSYVLMSAAGLLMTLTLSISKYISDKKEYRKKSAQRREIYENYLMKMRKKLHNRRAAEIDAYQYNYPNVTDLEEMVSRYSSRIYERNWNDEDFLQVKLGSYAGRVSFSIDLQYDELALEKDELLGEAREIKEQALPIAHKPIVADLKKAHLGIVGQKSNVHEQLKLIVSQLAFMQSYHDIECVVIYDAKYDKDFKWMRWYPHFKLRAINLSSLVNSEKMRDQILGSLTQILKDRRNKSEESKKESKFLPHYVFIIDEPKLIMDHSIMEYLDKEGDQLGFSIIYTSHFQADLPQNIGTVLLLEDSAQGTLLLNEKEIANRKVNLEQAGEIDFEKMARNLAVLIHEQGVVSQIPESITYFEMYHVERPEALRVKERWEVNESHKSLAVPLGVRSKDDLVYLNLHEKAHGPHGLVAGTTGSGKSEIVQSYILSLATSFHPYEVGFLLIDYKGGGMANLFKNLPHLLGTITNLDGSESMRAMASIKSELARRQKIFSRYEVNHINAYNKLFKLGKAEEPIPHLFLISDEFAELKKEQPDFMSELVSAARIGRSLGIHLILATQKPSGVVDDQIWTNSKFKLALKVQNESDSKEIIKTSDAAFITQPGRAYLQVGNNEIYELFQSAWSGAAYTNDTQEEVTDDRVYMVNELGQGELINQDLSKQTGGGQIKATQLDVVVDHIKEVFDGMQLPKVASPWLPPLESILVSPCIKEDVGDVKQYTVLDLEVGLGVVDIPEQQKQVQYQIDFAKDGHVAVFGASGFGKTFLISLIMMSVAVKNTAENVHYYILDFGNSGLIQYKNLPHTAEYMSLDDTEKITKLSKIITEEMKQRKRQFAKESAMNFEMYNQVAADKLPAIFLFVDNYDVVKELNMELEDFVLQVSRDGSSLGIYMVLGASRPGAIRYTIQNNMKNKLVLYMYDATDIYSLVGRTQYALSEIRGRGLIKLENVNQIQFYTICGFESLIDYMDSIKRMIHTCNEAYSGTRPKGIPVLPEELSLQDFKQYKKTGEKSFIGIGLDTEEVEVQYLDLNNICQVITGSTGSGKTNALRIITESINQSVSIVMADGTKEELSDYRTQENVSYHNYIQEMESFIKALSGMIESRKEHYLQAKEENPELSAKKFFETLDNVVLMVEEWGDFVEQVKNAETPELQKMLLELEAYQVTLIATITNGKLKGYDPLIQYVKSARNGLVLGTPSEQTVFEIPYIRGSNTDTSLGHLVNKGNLLKIKIPVVE